MKFRSIPILVLSLGCGSQSPAATTPETLSAEPSEVLANLSVASNRDIVTAAFEAIFSDFDEARVRALISEDYIQHNPGMPTGIEPIIGVLPALEESGIQYETHRIIADGDLVAMHNTYRNAQLFGAETLVGFDVFRVEDGRIVEHWDNLQAPGEPNPSGRTLTDGPTDLDSAIDTESSRGLVRGFADSILLRGEFSRLEEFVIGGEAYLQHNPGIGDGLAALGAGFQALAEQGMAISYTNVHHVIAENDFVLVLSEGTLGETPTAYYDLFRIADGKIVEHWDVISEIPAEMAHSNGKF